MDESGPAGSHTDEQLRMLRTRLYNRERQLVRMPAQKSTDQKVAATLTVMAASARSATGPVCYVCRRDGIFDRTARHPAAAVRVGICREPYVLNICGRHLAPLQATLPTGGLWLIERYQRQPDGQAVPAV